jgi:hypothetical protein
MLSCQQTQNVIDGKKRIILNPNAQQRTDFEGATFAADEVYGMDVLVSTGEDGKARSEESRTTVYQRDSTVTYQLKMQTSRKVFSDVQKKSGAFPFNIRALEDEKRARLGLQEAVQHSLVKPYDIVCVPAPPLSARGSHRSDTRRRARSSPRSTSRSRSSRAGRRCSRTRRCGTSPSS